MLTLARSAASGLVLLFASLLVTSALSADEWDTVRSANSPASDKGSDDIYLWLDPDPAVESVETILRKYDTSDMLAVEVLLLDRDVVFVNVVTIRDSATFLISSDDLKKLIETLEDAGFELTASSPTEEYVLGVQLLWI